MNDESTGSGSIVPASAWKTDNLQRSSSRPLTLVTDGVAVSGDAYAPTLVTAGTRSTGATSPPAARRRALPPGATISPKAKHAGRAILSACVDDLSRAIDDQEESIARNNALEQLKGKLSDLWKLRAEREESFAEVINMLQGLFLKRRVEDFSNEQLVCLRFSFEQLCQESVIDDEIANSLTIRLLNGGLDVFREIE